MYQNTSASLDFIRNSFEVNKTFALYQPDFLVGKDLEHKVKFENVEDEDESPWLQHSNSGAPPQVVFIFKTSAKNRWGLVVNYDT